MKRVFFILIINTFVLAACSTRYIQTDLYFGFSKPDGGSVSNDEWQFFLQDDISKVFPQGFTVIPAQGKWLDDSTKVLINEPSAIVIGIHPKNEAISQRIDSLSERYKRLFQQQAVLRVDKKVRVNF